MLDIKREATTTIPDFRMPSIKQEVIPPYSSSWEENNTIEHEWDSSFQLMQIESSEFMTAVAEFEQLDPAGLGLGLWPDQPQSPKQQIRNHDCMWSGTCGDQSHPGKYFGCGGNHSHGPQPQQEAAFNTVTAVAAASLNSQKATTILTPSNSSNIITPKINPAKAAQIPAGRSLLINPRVKQQQQVSRIPNVSTQDFLRERESTATHVRPDTPLSLDEDPPEFKHNIDLATCTIGSNRLSLTGSRHYSNANANNRHHDDASSSRIINMLKEQLEDHEGSLRPYMTSSSGEIGSLTDLLNDLEEIEGDDVDSSHGDEELDSDTESNSSRSSKGGGMPGGYTHAHDNSSSSSSSSSSYEYQGTHVGDHSYTLPKKRYNLNELGVQTPSDSEEEIDVVSIGEKNLPTNPTPRDRRALQSRVAHKIARKQAANGGVSSHHQHRRRHSDDESGYQQQFSSGVAGPSFQSPGKYGLSPNYLTPASSTSISGTNTPLPVNSRKRPSKDDRKNRHGSGGHRSNKKQRSGSVPSGSKKSPSQMALPPAAAAVTPATESSEEQETLEKRNLHNDMERQRRIGLKNLFEELKRQIPSLREKERAPKVNILREAAQLCNRLNREQEQLNALRKQQQRLYARVRQLRTSLHSQRRTMD
ncbi:hypothetical protein pipiens_000009, partial [Culex pipiens pipiens]